MPLGSFEQQILKVLAAHRNPDSFVAGATVLHQSADSIRRSEDVDLFHDTEQSLAECSERDITALRAAGFEVEAHENKGSFRRAIVRRGDSISKVEWVRDSAFRFFPIEPDVELGWRLNFWDAATNKVLALFGRQVIRDYLDCHYLHESHLHIGALMWAAAGKDPGLTPELIADWARRSTKYHPEDLGKVRLRDPVDLKALRLKWHGALSEAESLFLKLPPAEMGCLYLDGAGKPVCPEPASPEFAKLTRHFGCVKGAWPRIVEEE